MIEKDSVEIVKQKSMQNINPASKRMKKRIKKSEIKKKKKEKSNKKKGVKKKRR
jgi:hypothetical protein